MSQELILNGDLLKWSVIVDLPAEFSVWLTSPEAAFLNGRFAMANWDVEELKAKADRIQSGQLLTSGVNGWPFSPN